MIQIQITRTVKALLLIKGGRGRELPVFLLHEKVAFEKKIELPVISRMNTLVGSPTR